MRTPRIFCHQPLVAAQQLELASGPAQHVARVLRMGVGDTLRLFNGEGGEYPATICQLDRRRVTVLLADCIASEVESPLGIHLGISISRGDRMDWIVQKATELGVAALTPLFSQRTEVKLRGERADKKLQHWRQVAISACEQSGRNTLPRIHSPAELDRWLRQCAGSRRFVLHHRATAASAGSDQPSTIDLLVGPEGGLEQQEIAQAEAAGFESMSLGPRVLRTETAPLAALAILQARWGDMNPVPNASG